jgi:hypothetical protein
MKKLIAAAVATSVSAIAMADVSITGNANYEYFHSEANGYNTNYGDTEINLSVQGKTGDTTVVANFEVTHHGQTATAEALDIEDTYMTTKIGDVNVKAGNFASGTTALGGEIDQGSRATNKVDLNTKVGSATVGFAQALGTSATDAGGTDSAAVYASMDIAGVTVSVKEESDSYTLVGAKGSVNGINFRVEQKDNDSATTGDVLFYDIGSSFNGLDVSYAVLDADKSVATASTAGAVTEGDSSVFAQELATDSTSAMKANVDGINQVTVGTTIDGTKVKLRVGEITGAAGYQDAAFSRIEASRALAGGATLTVSYDDYEATGKTTSETMTDTQLLEIDLAVKF